MSKDFCILVDVGDKALADFIVETSLSLETSGHLVIVEASPIPRPLSSHTPFALAIFDSSRSCDELKVLLPKRPDGRPILSIHVGDEEGPAQPSKLICIPRETFEECFFQMLAFCYITSLIRNMVSDTEKLG